LDVRGITQRLDALMMDADRFDAGCKLVFDMYRGASKDLSCVTSKSLRMLSKTLTDRLGCQDPEILNQVAALLKKFEAAHAEEDGFNRDELKAYLLTVIALIQDKLRAEAQAPVEETVQPVRLRMRSADKLCLRSMEVEWQCSNGPRQHWSSWDNQVQNGWYEAEKVLPSDAADIKITFKVRSFKSKTVMRVDRKCHCKWIKDKVTKKYQQEVFWLRRSPKAVGDPIDAAFRLKGFSVACYVDKAWNAARRNAPEEWEHWEGKSPRPQTEPRLATLVAADKASPAAPLCDLDPVQFWIMNPEYRILDAQMQNRQARLIAAANRLVEIRRETINGLRKLDGSITKQWLGVNSANTATAGLAVGSAVTMFLAPPVGVGLGLAAAASGGMISAVDVSEDGYMLNTFRSQLSLDHLNAVAVAELENEWLLACEKLEMTTSWASSNSGVGNGKDELGVRSARVVQLGANLSNGAAQLADGATVTRGFVAASGPTARFLGVFGAVAATGVAVHGWCTTKFSQKAVRAKLAELTSSQLYMQRWLAGLERLECPICLESLSLGGEARRCSNNFHYFHATCLEDWCQTCGKEDWQVTCPECRGGVSSETQTLDDFITSDMRAHLDGLVM